MTRSSLIAVASMLALAGPLAACGGAAGSGPVPLTPTSRYALQVEPGVDVVAFAVHETGLSQNQSLVLRDMVNRFALEGAPTLVVEAPSGDDPVSHGLAWTIKGTLEAAGVPPHQIRVAIYEAPAPRAPVLVGFETVRAAVPQCGTSWTNLGRTGANAGYANFGCAVNANLAAQIANPRDIVAPRPMQPSAAARRAVVFDRYRAGEPTSATREPMVEGNRISNAVD